MATDFTAADRPRTCLGAKCRSHAPQPAVDEPKALQESPALGAIFARRRWVKTHPMGWRFVLEWVKTHPMALLRAAGWRPAPLAILRDRRLKGSRVPLNGRSRFAGASDHDFASAAFAPPEVRLFANGFER